MKHNKLSITGAAILCGSLAIFATPQFTLTGSPSAGPIDLGTLPGGTWTMAWYINNAGDVVGLGDDAHGNMHPWMVATRGPQAFQMQDLGTLGGEFSASNPSDTEVMAMAVNNQGLVVGHAFNRDGVLHGFAWTRSSGIVDLGTLEPGTWSAAMGVNDRGIIVGWAGASGWWWPDTVAVAWIPEGKGWQITKLTDDLDTSAFAINNQGQIVGGYDFVNQPTGLRWDPLPNGKGWQAQQLGSLPGYPFGYADANNEGGLAAGLVVPPDGSTFGSSVPALWKPQAGRGSVMEPTLLATLANPPVGPNFVDGMNDVGDLVGLSFDADGIQQAVHWRVGNEGSVETLGLPWGEALSVNNSGVAAGYGWTSEGDLHAFIVHLRSSRMER